MTTEWHGYPVNPNSSESEDIPPERVLQSWLNQGYVRPQKIRKLSQGKKCTL